MPARNTAIGVFNWCDASAEKRAACSKLPCSRSNVAFNTLIKRPISSDGPCDGIRSSSRSAVMRSAARRIFSIGVSATDPSHQLPAAVRSKTIGITITRLRAISQPSCSISFNSAPTCSVSS